MKTIYLTNKDDIQGVINSLNNEPHTLILSNGIYRNNFLINSNNLIIKGESRDKTIIISNKHANQVNRDLRTNITFRTETLKVTASTVTLLNLTIQNDSGMGPGVGQGVALSIYGTDVKVINCNIIGTHDTIFLGPLPLDLIDRYQGMIDFNFTHYDNPKHFFYNCKITGTVDFIFGSGESIFYKCEIISLKQGYLLAPSTYANSQLGLIIYNCTIINKDANPTYLARPWREHGYVAFINNEFIGSFNEARFNQWNKNVYRLYEHPYVSSKLGKPLPLNDLLLIESKIKTFLNS
ncbi:MAG TPA: hypothetical protein GX742_01295 [Acholeplasmataceae bacterium]|nr:hypothetical protein [Acholeplasmataceae bacterium]